MRVGLPNKFGFLFEPHRYKVAYGGRGAAKSWSYARALLSLARRQRTRILCARELQLSIKDSVHKLLCDQIAELGWSDEFDTTYNQIRHANGSEFIFSGLRANITKVKSMEGLDVVWVEEAETVSEESWAVLIPTIRKNGSEIYVTFNPDQETDPTYQRFIKSPPPGAKVVKIGWEDNHWISAELLKEKDYLYRIDASAADHVWGGATRKLNEAQVLFGKISIAPFGPGESWLGPYQGADWGFATDPTVLIRCWVREHKEDRLTLRDLHIEHEAYGVGVEVVDTPALFDQINGARRYVTRADKSRPETISHMRKNGYVKLVAAAQGPGSVEDGVMHLRSFNKIVIHPRCKQAIQESRLWCYKKDRLSGDILPVLIKKHDHCWDAARYALEPIMSKRRISHSGYQSARKKGSAGLSRKRGSVFRSRTGGIL